MEIEKVSQTKTCKHCQTSFQITDKDVEFYHKVSPTFGGKVFLIPTPTLCPDCRQQRRLSWRNERKLYHRKCDLTGKQTISIYSPDKLYKVYDQNEWWSDKWNPLDYGKDFDFSRPFFPQFDELLKEVPQTALFASNNENSDYTNYSETEKNCYLVFASNRNENCFYSSMIWDSVNCMDCYALEKSQNCYDLVDGANCYNVNFSENVFNSSFCNYVYDCDGCNYCVGCTGLRNKSYYILNKPFPKEEYTKIISDPVQQKYIIEYFQTLKKNQVRLYENIKNCEKVSGGNLMNCKNCTNCFNSFGLEDSKYTENSPGNSSFVYDVSGCTNTKFSYELGSIANGYNMLFSGISYLQSNNQLYSMNCHNSSYLFGCVSVRSKSYCILNKQYTKEEYEILVPKIIEHMKKTGEWGEFFPSSISPFGYNETVAIEYFPLTREQIADSGFNRSDYEKQNGYDGEFYRPLDIKQYDERIVGKEKAEQNKENILKGILQCEATKKPFKIIRQELEFYINHSLPIPKRNPDQRHLDRMTLRNPRKLFSRKCDKCGIQMQTTYVPTRPEKVYCEKCYNEAVY